MCLPEFLSMTDLVDVCRLYHPEGREFTHFSHAHNSWPRIDYFVLLRHLLSRVEHVSIRDRVISDMKSMPIHDGLLP